jgi:hypothetical protein
MKSNIYIYIYSVHTNIYERAYTRINATKMQSYKALSNTGELKFLNSNHSKFFRFSLFLLSISFEYLLRAPAINLMTMMLIIED